VGGEGFEGGVMGGVTGGKTFVDDEWEQQIIPQQANKITDRIMII